MTYPTHCVPSHRQIEKSSHWQIKWIKEQRVMNKDKTHSSNEVLIPFANPIAIGLLISWFAHSSHRQMASRIQPKQRILLVFSDVFELFWPTACMEQRCYLITHKEAFAMIKNNYSYLSQWHKFSWKSISDSWSLKFCDFVTRNHRAEKTGWLLWMT